MPIRYNSDLAIADIPSATYDDLRARFAALARVTDAVGAERAALWREIQRREIAAAVEARLSALSADGKAAALAVLNG